MKERGMMKWLSYKSLNEQEKALNKMLEKKTRIEKPSISKEKAEEIDEILQNYAGEEVRLYFFANGHVKESFGEIDKIDPIYKIIEMNHIRIQFSMIVGLEKI